MNRSPDPRAVTARLNDPTVHALTVAETAIARDCSTNHAYAMVTSGEWPSIRNGRRVLIPAAWVRSELHIEIDRARP